MLNSCPSPTFSRSSPDLHGGAHCGLRPLGALPILSLAAPAQQPGPIVLKFWSSPWPHSRPLLFSTAKSPPLLLPSELNIFTLTHHHATSRHRWISMVHSRVIRTFLLRWQPHHPLGNRLPPPPPPLRPPYEAFDTDGNTSLLEMDLHSSSTLFRP